MLRSLRQSMLTSDPARVGVTTVSAIALADADGAMKGGVRDGSSLDADQKLLALEILVAGSSRSIRAG